MDKAERPGPLVSVLMGVYCRRDDTAALERSIASLLGQSMGDFELIICDSGSSPAVSAFLDGMAAGDGRIRLLRDESLPTDLASKLNFCLAAAKAPFIARMDDDDRCAPERFEVQLDYLREHGGLGFVGSNVRLVRQGEIVGERRFPEFPGIEDHLFTQPYIHPALMFRREALEAVGGYSTDRHCVLCEDYDLLLRLYGAGFRGGNVQSALLDYTIPAPGQDKRRMSHRLNESITRYRRFSQLGLLPRALPYVIKPLAVGLLPESARNAAKKLREGRR